MKEQLDRLKGEVESLEVQRQSENARRGSSLSSVTYNREAVAQMTAEQQQKQKEEGQAKKSVHWGDLLVHASKGGAQTTQARCRM